MYERNRRLDGSGFPIVSRAGYKISVNADKRVSRFPGWVGFPWPLVEVRKMLLWFRNSFCATCRGDEYGGRREHERQQERSRPAIRHDIPSRTQERMR
jgi:hypothetical protein